MPYGHMTQSQAVWRVCELLMCVVCVYVCMYGVWPLSMCALAMRLRGVLCSCNFAATRLYVCVRAGSHYGIGIANYSATNLKMCHTHTYTSEHHAHAYMLSLSEAHCCYYYCSFTRSHNFTTITNVRRCFFPRSYYAFMHTNE